MTDNLFLGPDAQARFSVQMLRAHDGKGAISGEITRITEGAFVSVDPEARVSGSYRASRSNMVALNMSVPRAVQPRWQGLHFVMGGADMSDSAVLGLVVRSKAAAAMNTRVCLRSGRGDQITDTFFDKQIVSFAQPSTHLDILDLSQKIDVPRKADWRDLILFFRPGPVDVELLDLRVFIA